ncbi:MAG: hypothetical protein FIA97_10910 [Methylococcaceae bacterium]|nr:hypothetical protein [Methylococcaceae bacterium]
MKSSFSHFSAAALVVFSSAATAEFSRNYIAIVGSSTLQPLSAAVAEQIAKSKKVKPPKIESTGTNGGFTLFCEGEGSAYPDIVNAARPMHQRELDNCRNAGVNDVVEIKVGYGGPVLVQASKATPLSLSRHDLYLALAEQLPDPSCAPGCEKLINNPNQRWKQINPTLPDTPIEVMGPPASSGLSEALAEAVLETGCDSVPWLAAHKARNDGVYKKACHSIRKDAAYTEETGETVLSRIGSEPDRLGIVSFANFSGGRSGLRSVAVEGVAPDDDSLASRRYPLTTPVLFYVKRAHADSIPGLKTYLTEFTGDKAWGAKGYLAKKGLVPMPAGERETYTRIARDLTVMTAAGQAPAPAIVAEAKPEPAPKPQSTKKHGKHK